MLLRQARFKEYGDVPGRGFAWAVLGSGSADRLHDSLTSTPHERHRFVDTVGSAAHGNVVEFSDGNAWAESHGTRPCGSLALYYFVKGDLHHMAATTNRFRQVLNALRKEESVLESQLGKVRDALGALGGVGKAYQRRQSVRRAQTIARNVRTMSAAQKKAVSERMKKYWARRRAKKS
jgi:hypothetical protein